MNLFEGMGKETYFSAKKDYKNVNKTPLKVTLGVPEPDSKVVGENYEIGGDYQKRQ